MAGLDRTGGLPVAPSGIATQVAGTARSYFHPHRLCVPIADVTLLGVIDAGPRQASAYEPADMHWLEALAAHAGVALNNAKRLRQVPLEAAAR